MNNSDRGFSLIELMIVVAIVAILAAVAIPSYQGSVIKNNRSAAKTALMTLVSRQEKYFVNNKSYATDITDLGYPATTYYVDSGGDASASATGAVYRVSLSTATSSTFTAAAVPLHNQANDTSCGTLSLNHRGVETASGSGSGCW